MNLILFTESDQCRAYREANACHMCRSSCEFRLALSKIPKYRFIDDNINFDCPHGIQWIGPRPPPLYVRSREKSDASIITQTANVLSGAAHAAISVAKTTLGINAATDEQVEARLNVCRKCPGSHATFKPDGSLHTCGPMFDSMRQAGKWTCGCILTKKARDLAESCPFGWWPNDRPGDSRGLGDTVANITKKLHIKPCKGCKKRQELLNKLVPYKEDKTLLYEQSNGPDAKTQTE